MSRWSRGCAAAVIGAALALSGCGREAYEVAAPPPNSAPGADVMAAAMDVRPTGCPALGPVGALPAAAQIVGVLRCIPSTEQVAGDGEYSVSVQQRATGAPVSAIMSALALPSEPRTDQACSADGVGPVAVELETASGAVTVDPPRDACRKPRSEVRAAFEALPWVTVTTTRGQKVRSDEAAKAGCPLRKDEIALTANDATPGAVAAQLAQGAAVSVCRYRSTGGDGDPVGGGQLTADEAQRLATLLASAGPAAPCAQTHTSFAVVTAAGSEPLSVELDGCRRILAPGAAGPTLRQANADLVGLLQAH